MYIDMGCKRLRQILEPFRAAAKANTAEETSRIMKKLESLFPDTGKKETVPVVSSTPAAPAEPLSLAEKRGKQFNFREIDLFYYTFKCISHRVQRPVTWTASATFSWNLGIADAATPSKSDLKTAQTVRKLLMGRFVGDLLHTMDENIKNPKNGSSLGFSVGMIPLDHSWCRLVCLKERRGLGRNLRQILRLRYSKIREQIRMR
ncbi:hypothetical protein BJ741DRAFT_674610 [Chytriomyces cf. hyalinus JEL632]|nr:hypothetical protein BJ741DRAFT_674610 [Chytriomyces cf. hyalinus JEL632]